MDDGIDINDLPGVHGRAPGRNHGLVKPGDVLHARVHRPEIRRIPNLPEAWNRPPRFVTFLRIAGEYLGVLLKFILLLTLGGAAVVAILFGGYFIVEAVVSWVANAALDLIDWVFSGVQYLARSAVELVVGLVVGAIQFVIDAIIWVVVSIIEGVIDLVLFVINSFIEFWVGLFTFVMDLIAAILITIFDLLFTILLGVAIGVLIVMLSPVLVPLAILYYAYISIF